MGLIQFFSATAHPPPGELSGCLSQSSAATLHTPAPPGIAAPDDASGPRDPSVRQLDFNRMLALQ